jgi:hypothetical protein
MKSAAFLPEPLPELAQIDTADQMYPSGTIEGNFAETVPCRFLVQYA